jgi:hypothetical protein
MNDVKAGRLTDQAKTSSIWIKRTEGMKVLEVLNRNFCVQIVVFDGIESAARFCVLTTNIDGRIIVTECAWQGVSYDLSILEASFEDIRVAIRSLLMT